MPLSKVDRQQSARAQFKQHSAEHSGADKQQTDGPDRVLVNHIGVHDEAHDVAYLFRLTGGMDGSYRLPCAARSR
ncbi:MAG TPA: hypothetical protein VNY06_08725 [Methylocella sp.]|nr:hypothetical protein [Methylocella sp.]